MHHWFLTKNFDIYNLYDFTKFFLVTNKSPEKSQDPINNPQYIVGGVDLSYDKRVFGSFDDIEEAKLYMKQIYETLIKG